MNNFLRWGLILQIPNGIALFIAMFMFGGNWLIYNASIEQIFLAILVAAFCLVNIASIVMICVGIFGKKKEEDCDYY